MKRISYLLVLMIICVSLVACGGNTDSKGNTSTENNQTETNQQIPETESKTEKNIDAVAEKLGLTDGTEVMYDLIGAVAGKQYNDGNIELYQFDENSDAYKNLISGKTYLTPAAYKDGIVLIFAFGFEEDVNLINSFNALEF